MNKPVVQTKGTNPAYLIKNARLTKIGTVDDGTTKQAADSIYKNIIKLCETYKYDPKHVNSQIKILTNIITWERKQNRKQNADIIDGANDCMTLMREDIEEKEAFIEAQDSTIGGLSADLEAQDKVINELAEALEKLTTVEFEKSGWDVLILFEYVSRIAAEALEHFKKWGGKQHGN